MITLTRDKVEELANALTMATLYARDEGWTLTAHEIGDQAAQVHAALEQPGNEFALDGDMADAAIHFGYVTP